MYRQLLIALSVLASGCDSADTTTEMSHDAACHEQADAWCTAVGYGSSEGCRSFYLSECEPAGPSAAPMSTDAQDACLQAIADGVDAVHDAEPVLCQETWK